MAGDSAMTAVVAVRNDIVNGLKEQMRRKAVDEFVDRLKSNAKIEERRNMIIGPL